MEEAAADISVGAVLLTRAACSRPTRAAAPFRGGGEQVERIRVRTAKQRQDGMAERLHCNARCWQEPPPDTFTTNSRCQSGVHGRPTF